MKKIRFNLFIVLLLTSISVLAQQRGTITGKASTKDGKAVDNIAISLEGTRYGTMTDNDGTFNFTCPVGKYTLVATALDYKTLKIQIDVTAGENKIDISLEESINELDEITVLGAKQGIMDKESDYIAKLPLKNLENPQVYSVISKELIKQQVIVNFDDIVKNSSGIDKLWSSTGRGGDGAAYFTIRGFSVQPTMINGLGSQTNGSLDPSSIERVEVLKGPSGTLFGSSLISFGGLINVVTKQPFDAKRGELSYTMGGDGLVRMTADINTPLDKKGKTLFRVNTAYQTENSFQDAGFRKSFFVAPSLVHKASDRLTFTINSEFYTSEGTNPLMVFLNRARPLEYTTPKELDMDYNKSFTSNDIRVKTPTVRLFGMAEYKISDQWKSQTSISQSIRKSEGLYSYVMFLGEHDDYLSRYVGSQDATGTATDFQQNFIGDFKIGDLRNRLVVGVDVFGTTEKSLSNYILFDNVHKDGKGDNYGSLNYHAVSAKLAAGSGYNSKVESNTYSAYFSDVLNITDQLLVMGSLRVDHFKNKGEGDNDYSQTAVSPKFGGIYQILPEKLSVFANYMNGFQNVAPSTNSTTGVVTTYKPQQANQIEGGIKANIIDGKLLATVSYYNINVNNILRPAADPLEPSVQDGEIYSRGFEIDITATPVQGMNVILGYSKNKSENKKTSSDILDRRPVGAGPETLVNGWVSYTIQNGVAEGLGFGFGGNYASENIITNDANVGQFTIPAYTVLNASVFYNVKTFNFALKANNLADKQYWKGWTTVEAQKSRQIIGSISYRF